MHLDNNEDFNTAYFARSLLVSEKNLLYLCSESRILNDKVSSIEIRKLANIFKITPDVMEKKIEDIKNKYSKKDKKLTRKLRLIK